MCRDISWCRADTVDGVKILACVEKVAGVERLSSVRRLACVGVLACGGSLVCVGSLTCVGMLAYVGMLACVWNLACIGILACVGPCVPWLAETLLSAVFPLTARSLCPDALSQTEKHGSGSMLHTDTRAGLMLLYILTQVLNQCNIL